MAVCARLCVWNAALSSRYARIALGWWAVLLFFVSGLLSTTHNRAIFCELEPGEWTLPPAPIKRGDASLREPCRSQFGPPLQGPSQGPGTTDELARACSYDHVSRNHAPSQLPYPPAYFLPGSRMKSCCGILLAYATARCSSICTIWSAVNSKNKRAAASRRLVHPARAALVVRRREHS